MANYHPLLGHYEHIYLGGARVVMDGQEDKGDYQLELLPPEGRGAPICVQGYQSNCSTHAVLTEGAMLDENGHHIYPIQGPPVTVHTHFGSSQALGVVRVPVRLLGDPTGRVVHLVCVVTPVRDKKEIWGSRTEICQLPEVGVMYAKRGIVYSPEFLDLAENRQEAWRASGAFDEQASNRAEAILRRRRALAGMGPTRSIMDDEAWLNDLQPNGASRRGGSASSKKKCKKKKKKQKKSKVGKGGKGVIKQPEGGRLPAAAAAQAEEEEEEEDEEGDEDEEQEGAGGGAAQSAAVEEDKEDEDELTDNDCSTCFYPFGDRETVDLECHHRFHRECMADWEKRCKDTLVEFHCPLCRRPINISLGR